MSVEAFRVRFFNLVIETSQKFSLISQEEINGNRGLLAIKDDIIILNWSNNDTSFSLQGNVEESVLLNIAQNIEKNK